ncbi:chaperonin 10-like protein, partial [Baffinella frigidus]
QAAVVKETGSVDVLKIESAWPVPAIVDGQVLVKNEFAGINFIDTYHRSGMYKRDLPFVGGQEGGGVIAATTPKVGGEAMGFKVGGRVAYSSLYTLSRSRFTEFALRDLLLSDTVGLDVATACGVQGMTAHYLTSTCNADLIKPGEWCLIHGVGGGTCQWAAQRLSKRALPSRHTRPPQKYTLATFRESSRNFFNQIKLNPKHPVGRWRRSGGTRCPPPPPRARRLSARRGIFISFGNASGAVPAFPVLRLIGKSAYVTRPKLLDYTTDREEMLYRSGEIFKWLGDGSLKVAIDTTFKLDEAAEGHKYLEAGKSTGKVLYKI